MFKVYEFHWKGINRFGQKQKGKKLAEKATQVEAYLLSQGVESIKIQRNFVLSTKPKNEQITQWLNQLVLLLYSTIPLKQSLVILLENCTNRHLYLWMKKIIFSLESGFSFSAALEKEQCYLNTQEIQLIKIGERSGKLTTILTSMVNNRLKSEKLNKKVKKILFYPMMVLMISLLLSVILLLFIVPKFAELYSAKREQLPFITKALFSLSDLLQHSLLWIISSGIALVILGLCFRKSQCLSYINYFILSMLPLFSTIISDKRVILFCQNSSLMLNAHLRLDVILGSFIQKQSEDPLLGSEMKRSMERLKQGYRLSESLNPQFFTSEVLQMIAVGEKSGQLAQMLLYIAEMYQQKLEYKTDLLAQLLEPILMLILGGIVGTILIGLYLPIFDMGSMIE